MLQSFCASFSCNSMPHSGGLALHGVNDNYIHEPVLKNIYQSNTYGKDLSWPHFNDVSRVQEKYQVKDKQSCIFVLVACLTIPSSN